MSRRHHSPRHLDDPLRPVFGLSIPQATGALIALLGGFLTWKLCSLLPGDSIVFTELRLFLSGSSTGLLFFLFYVLVGDRSEPFARQLWSFTRRAHTYQARRLTEQEYVHAPAHASYRQHHAASRPSPQSSRARRTARRHRRCTYPARRCP